MHSDMISMFKSSISYSFIGGQRVNPLNTAHCYDSVYDSVITTTTQETILQYLFEGNCMILPVVVLNHLLHYIELSVRICNVFS